MARRWATAWEFEAKGWIDVALDEPAILTDEESRDIRFDMPWESPGRRRLKLWRPFVVRCAPGSWQVDLYLQGDVVLEARLRRPEHRRRRWNWGRIAAGEASLSEGGLWGFGDLNGGSFSFVQLSAADHFLGTHEVPRGVLQLGDPAQKVSVPRGADHLAVVSLGGAALTITQTIGDVPFLVAMAHHGAPGNLEVGWGLPEEFWT